MVQPSRRRHGGRRVHDGGQLWFVPRPLDASFQRLLDGADVNSRISAWSDGVGIELGGMAV